MNLTELSFKTPTQLVTSLGKLYIIMSDRDEEPTELGKIFQQSAQRKLDLRDELNIPAPYYLAVDDGIVIGYGLIQMKIGQDQPVPPSCYSFIFVHPDYRRRGVASNLLKEMLFQFRNSSLSSIFFFAEDEVGQQFLTKHGGKITEHGLTYELELQTPTKEINLPTGLEVFINPEATELQEFIEVRNLAKKDEPTGNNDRILPLTARDYIDFMQSSAEEHLVAQLRHRGKIVAITDIMDTGIEGKLFQRFTGTHPDHRSQGYATILKQGVLNWLQLNRSEKLPATIETGTHAENKAMQRVNTKVGYKLTGEEITIEFYNN